jgi:hypothetical protein
MKAIENEWIRELTNITFFFSVGAGGAKGRLLRARFAEETVES